MTAFEPPDAADLMRWPPRGLLPSIPSSPRRTSRRRPCASQARSAFLRTPISRLRNYRRHFSHVPKKFRKTYQESLPPGGVDFDGRGVRRPYGPPPTRRPAAVQVPIEQLEPLARHLPKAEGHHGNLPSRRQ